MPLKKFLTIDTFPSIPDNLRDILSEFTIACMLEKPENVIDYAAKYFTKYQSDRKKTVSEVEMQMFNDDSANFSSDEELPDNIENQLFNRRHSVFAESFDPSAQDDGEIAVSIYPKTPEQYKYISETVKDIFVFRLLDEDQLCAIINAMFERTVSAGEIVTREGDDSNYFFVVASGQYTVTVANQIVTTINNYGCFGELALMYNLPRPLTITANTVGKLWAIDRKTFRRISLTAAFKKNTRYDRLISSVSILKMLSGYDRMKLADALVTLKFSSGKQIVKQGDESDGIYFIENGIVSVTKIIDGIDTEVMQMRNGDHFGELKLMVNQSRSNSVFAVSDEVKLAFLDTKIFERLVSFKLNLN